MGYLHLDKTFEDGVIVVVGTVAWNIQLWLCDLEC